MMRKRTHSQAFVSGAILFAGLLMPLSAVAYTLPEEILFTNEIYGDLYLPPTPRGGQAKIADQQFVSQMRREEEQEAFFAAQRPPEPEVEEEVMHAAAPAEPSDPALTEFKSTLRLLERITERQNAQQLGEQLRLLGYHPGAPSGGGYHGGKPLAPTGAGSILTALSMIGAMGWTLRRSRTKARTEK